MLRKLPLFCLLGSAVCANELPTYHLTEFTVVAPHVRIPSTVIRNDTMRSAKPMDLAAILSNKLPAAALSRKSPLAGDLVLRGMSRDNVLITIDNNKTFCACPNRMDPPAFHVSSQQVESVEIRTGPFSVDRGASIGGSVAVSTRAPSEDSEASAYAYAGSFDYFAAGFAGTAVVSGQTRVSGGLHHQEGGVFEDGSGLRFTELAGTNYLDPEDQRDAFRVQTGEVKTSHQLENGLEIEASFAFQNASDVLYPGLMMDAPEDEMHRGSLRLKDELDLSFADQWQAIIAFSHVDHLMTDARRTTRNNMGGAFFSRGYFMLTEAESGYTGLQVEAQKDLADDSLLRYGTDLQRRTWNADNVIANLRNDMLPDVEADQFGFWIVSENRRGDWAWEAGARLDLSRSEAGESLNHIQLVRGTNTNQRDDVLPSGYLMMSRDIAPRFNIYGGIGYATRAPDPQERYMNLDRPMGSDWVGNPDLDPVHNLEFQTGFNWQGERLALKGSAFHAWLDDLVYLEALPAPNPATSYTNIDARLYGFSLDGSWQALETLSFEAGLAWQQGEKRNRPTGATNDVLGEIPPLKGRVAAEWQSDKLTVGSELVFQDSYDRVDPDLTEKPISGWASVNLVASYQFNDSLGLTLGVDNLFDKNYAVANAFVRDPFRNGLIVNEPGRFIYLRVGLVF